MAVIHCQLSSAAARQTRPTQASSVGTAGYRVLALSVCSSIFVKVDDEYYQLSLKAVGRRARHGLADFRGFA